MRVRTKGCTHNVDAKDDGTNGGNDRVQEVAVEEELWVVAVAVAVAELCEVGTERCYRAAAVAAVAVAGELTWRKLNMMRTMRAMNKPPPMSVKSIFVCVCVACVLVHQAYRDAWLLDGVAACRPMHTHTWRANTMRPMLMTMVMPMAMSSAKVL